MYTYFIYAVYTFDITGNTTALQYYIEIKQIYRRPLLSIKTIIINTVANILKYIQLWKQYQHGQQTFAWHESYVKIHSPTSSNLEQSAMFGNILVDNYYRMQHKIWQMKIFSNE